MKSLNFTTLILISIIFTATDKNIESKNNQIDNKAVKVEQDSILKKWDNDDIDINNEAYTMLSLHGVVSLAEIGQNEIWKQKIVNINNKYYLILNKKRINIIE